MQGGRRRQLIAGGDDAEAQAGQIDPAATPPAAPAKEADAGGSTLFERMANLSRGSSSKDEDDEDDDGEDNGGSLNIPRFLGRQNNQ